MRYRKQTSTGDYVVGQGQGTFFVNDPDGVAQAVKTRLLLITGEWFLDTTEGTPYLQEVLGVGTKPIYDAAIRERILDTEGVNSLVDYSSDLNPTTRKLSVNATIDTIYGNAILDLVL